MELVGNRSRLYLETVNETDDTVRPYCGPVLLFDWIYSASRRGASDNALWVARRSGIRHRKNVDFGAGSRPDKAEMTITYDLEDLASRR